MTRRAVFLDRDGVLNRAVVRDGRPFPPASMEELHLLPGVTLACAKLREAGAMLVVVTNQPDIARGTTTRDAVDALNRELARLLNLHEVRMCPHDDADGCACRKPRPGMLLEAARVWNIDLSASFMVGDRWRDVEAGEQAGCTTVFVDHGYNERLPRRPCHTVKSLWEAVPFILRSLQSSSPAGSGHDGRPEDQDPSQRG